MKKGDWYKHLFARVDHSIEKEFFFEACFICYGIIEDRLGSLMDKYGIPVGRKGVAAKIRELSKVKSANAEKAFLFKNWDGGKYLDKGHIKDVLAWGELYRNPMQHLLGDPRKYKATIGDFHIMHTKDMALEGKRVARELSVL